MSSYAIFKQDPSSGNAPHSDLIYTWQDRPAKGAVSIGRRGAMPPQEEIEFTPEDVKKVQKASKKLRGWKKASSLQKR
jgi:hypothetical protein